MMMVDELLVYIGTGGASTGGAVGIGTEGGEWLGTLELITMLMDGTFDEDVFFLKFHLDLPLLVLYSLFFLLGDFSISVNGSNWNDD